MKLLAGIVRSMVFLIFFAGAAAFFFCLFQGKSPQSLVRSSLEKVKAGEERAHKAFGQRIDTLMGSAPLREPPERRGAPAAAPRTAEGMPYPLQTAAGYSVPTPAASVVVDTRPVHGGQVASSQEFRYEVVAGQGMVKMYVYDLFMRPVDVSNLSGRVVLQGDWGPLLTVQLSPAPGTSPREPGYLEGAVDLPGSSKVSRPSTVTVQGLPGKVEGAASFQMTL